MGQHVQIKRLTIKPQDDSLGHLAHRNLLKGRGIECDPSDQHQQHAERVVMVCLLGPAAAPLRALRDPQPVAAPRSSIIPIQGIKKRPPS